MITCRRCGNKFESLSLHNPCGGGWSWSLYKCPNCGQEHAFAGYMGFVPESVKNDTEVVVIESYDIV